MAQPGAATIVNPKGQPPWPSYTGECQAVTYDGAGNFDLQRSPAIFKTLNAIATGSEITAWTPAAGKKFRIMGGFISVGTAAGAITIKDNTAGTTILIVPKSPVDTPIYLTIPGNGILSGAANNVLTMTGAATSTVSGTIWGTEE